MTSTPHGFQSDQRLALAYARRELRPRFEALLRYDLELAAAVSAVSEPLLGQVRLAWWRDVFTNPSVAETARVPLLADLAGIGHHDVIFAHLLQMVNGWETLLSCFPIGAEPLREYAEGRGGGLFLAAARSSGCTTDGAFESGIGWALADFAFRCSDAETARTAHELARQSLSFPRRMPGTMRPFAMLARFARTDSRRDLQQGSAAESPSRLLDTAKVVLTGK